MNIPAVITLANNKGGVGKTTSVTALAHICATDLNKKVLVIDADPQGNSSDILGFHPDRSGISSSLYELFMAYVSKQKYDVKKYIHKTDYKNLDIITGSGQLNAIEFQLMSMMSQYDYVYKMIVNQIAELNKYEIIFFDTHPGINAALSQVLMATEWVILPTEPNIHSVDGVAQLNNAIEISSRGNPNLKFLGTFLTKVHSGSNTTKDLDPQLKEVYNDKYFKTKIPTQLEAGNATGAGVPITEYNKNSRISKAYKNLALEVFEKINGYKEI